MVRTDVDYTVANLGGKKWRLEFKSDRSNSSSEAVFMQGGTQRSQEWYYKTGYIKYWTEHSYWQISDSTPQANDEIAIEFDGIDKLDVYINGVLDKTTTGFDPGYLNSSSNAKIQIGGYSSGSYVFTGTFEYIRFGVYN